VHDTLTDVVVLAVRRDGRLQERGALKAFSFLLISYF
jgi:hypothetical protein